MLMSALKDLTTASKTLLLAQILMARTIVLVEMDIQATERHPANLKVGSLVLKVERELTPSCSKAGLDIALSTG